MVCHIALCMYSNGVCISNGALVRAAYQKPFCFWNGSPRVLCTLFLSLSLSFSLSLSLSLSHTHTQHTQTHTQVPPLYLSARGSRSSGSRSPRANTGDWDMIGTNSLIEYVLVTDGICSLTNTGDWDMVGTNSQTHSI